MAFLTLASSQPRISVSPTRVTTPSPGIGSSEVNETPCLVRKSLALSQSLNLDHGPTKTWKWQSPAATLIGVLAEAASSSGFTKWVRPLNKGWYKTAPSRQP